MYLENSIITGMKPLPVNSVLLSSENRRNRVNEATEVDKRTAEYKRRMLSMRKGTQAMLNLLKAAKKAVMNTLPALLKTHLQAE